MRFPVPRLRRAFLPVVLGLAAACAVSTAQAQWMDLATVSSTIGNNANRLCVGGGRTDLGCPANAPLLNTAAGLLTVPTDLRVVGNLYVSGTQSFDGVTFANGGVSATGIVSATYFAGNGALLTGVVASSADWYTLTNIPLPVQAVSNGTVLVMAGISATNVSVTTNLTIGGALTAGSAGFGSVAANSVSASLVSATNISGTNATLTAAAINGLSVGNLNATTVTATNARVTNDLYVGGNFYVSGSQTIDGVSFANGGVSATGTVTATHFSGNGSGLTGVVASSADWYTLTNIPLPVQAVSNGTALVMAGISATNVSVTGNLGAAAVTAATGSFSAIGANSLSSTLVSASNISGTFIDATRNGTVSATYGYFRNISGTTGRIAGDLYIGGNFYVSGSQSIDGVVFANGGVSATGIITATAFSGDGSGLTGVTAASSDRIVSGTTQAIANNNGNIEFKTGSTTTGYYTPGGILAAVGVSTTGTVSGTSLFSTGRIESRGGLLLNQGSGSLDNLIYTGSASTGAVNASIGFFAAGAGSSGEMHGPYFLARGNTFSASAGQRGNIYFSAGTPSAAGPTEGTLNFMTNGGIKLFIDNTGDVGIGTTNPGHALEVSGTVSATNIDVTSVRGTVSGTYGYFRYISGTTIQGAFVGDGSGLTGVTAASSDRIVSGTTQAIANNNGNIEFKTGSTTTGYYTPGGILAAVGVSTTDTVSATGLYTAGTVGIGTPASATTMLLISSTGLTGVNHDLINAKNAYGTAIFNVQETAAGNGTLRLSNSSGSNRIFLSSVVTSNGSYFNTGGNFGLNNAAPSQTLHVTGGTVITSWTGINFSSLANVTPTAPLEVSGTVSATRFVGDGSGLTNLNFSGFTPDRIVSGTTQAIANNNGNIEFKTGSTTTGYYTPGGILAAVGISTTDLISASGLYVTGTVGIGTAPSTSSLLTVQNPQGSNPQLMLMNQAMTSRANFRAYGDGPSSLNPGLDINVVGDDPTLSHGIRFFRQTNTSGAVGISLMRGNNSTAVGARIVANGVSPTYFNRFGGNLGIGTDEPSQTLHVAGTTFTSSWTYLNGNINARVTPTAPLEVSGTVSATNFVGDGSGLTNIIAASSDRIVSGTTQAIANNNGNIEFKTGSTTTGYYTPGGVLAAVGISTTDTVSATSLYTAGTVGIGTPASATTMLLISSTGLTGVNHDLINAKNAYGNAIFNVQETATGNGTLRLSNSSGSNRIFLSSVVTSNGSYFNTGGNFGLNNAAPSQTLHVTGGALTTSWTGINFSSLANVTPTAPLEVSGTVSATHFVGDGSGLTNLNFSGFTPDRIVSGTTSVTASQNNSISLVTAGTERMVIGTNGNIGIGTSAPTNSFQVSASAAAFGGPNSGVGFVRLLAGNSTNTGYTDYQFANGASLGYVGFGNTNLRLWARSTYGLAFGASNTEVMRMLSDGNIGIGLITPTTALEVSGTVSATAIITPALTATTGSFNAIGTNTLSSTLVSASNISGTFIDATRNGTVSATYGYFRYISGTTVQGTFIGDGSGLTNLPSQTPDRIVSGTTYILASQNSSLTLTTAGSAALTVGADGLIDISSTGLTTRLARLNFGTASEPKIQLWGTGGTSFYGFGISTAQLNYVVNATASHVFYAGGTNNNGTELLRINNSGASSSTLAVSGSASVSGSLRLSSTPDSCNSSRYGTMMVQNGKIYLCRQ